MEWLTEITAVCVRVFVCLWTLNIVIQHHISTVPIWLENLNGGKEVNGCGYCFSCSYGSLFFISWHQEKQIWLKTQFVRELCAKPTQDQEVILTDNPISRGHPVPSSVTWWVRIVVGRWQEECLLTSLSPTGSPTATATVSCQVIH